MKHWIRGSIVCCALAASGAWGQIYPAPSEGGPVAGLPNLPLTVIFKEVMRQADVQSVLRALEQTQVVKSMAMYRAQRGLIEYRGHYFGEIEFIMKTLRMNIGSQIALKTRGGGANGLEILVTSQSL